MLFVLGDTPSRGEVFNGYIYIILGIGLLTGVVCALRVWDTPAYGLVGLVLLVIIFTSLHTFISASDANAFSKPLDKPSAFYFTITTMSTTGFGDIVPLSTTARMIVAAQMLAGIILVGAFLAATFSALGQRRAERTIGPLEATNEMLRASLDAALNLALQVTKEINQMTNDRRKPAAGDARATPEKR